MWLKLFMFNMLKILLTSCILHLLKYFFELSTFAHELVIHFELIETIEGQWNYSELNWLLRLHNEIA
jgi:hypothetical protein